MYVITVGVSEAGSGDLASILEEVNRLRVQLERCISSNDQLRYTLQKSGGAVVASAADGPDLLADQRDGQLLAIFCEMWKILLHVVSF